MSKIIEQLGGIITSRRAEVEKWFEEQYSKTIPLFYSSVDLRHSGFKIAPVDTNLFPAGFNLLSKQALEKASHSMKEYLNKNFPSAKKLVIIPENHTRNLYYLENIATLQSALKNTGLEVRLGGLQATEALNLSTASGREISLEPISVNNRALQINDFIPDIILLNNDLSSGLPDILKDISQPILPATELGWYRRRKTSHFETYAEVSRNFARKFGFDEWLISTAFDRCGKINFKERQGLECVSISVEKVLSKLRKKYIEHGINSEPYVFIKADSGTYGMGIMTARSGLEVMEINKKDRNKMNTIKEGVSNNEVIIQEGVPTIDMIDGKVAEPLMYLVGGRSVGCTFRINENRDAFSNLNSQGMTFQSACDGDAEKPIEEKEVCPVQGTVARLASLAASFECYEPKWDI